ncbi:uncharacterized protein F5891DRAFT_982893 [Suillus fuscotomentosus]|uniref:Uncharacterized protein n=1 Tax=Suillus fuscotomentosus TaxID=1912939 RepID=A0AAD4DZQ9_9AGAM|nr:uncharacterized protein F5891DRAFT_982893 [Suillus fuscotomentosus]KAG1897084.1 hypothetical protein F5891DRAFT_982893 [Suillus fuscotomentosus]
MTLRNVTLAVLRSNWQNSDAWRMTGRRDNPITHNIECILSGEDAYDDCIANGILLKYEYCQPPRVVANAEDISGDLALRGKSRKSTRLALFRMKEAPIGMGSQDVAWSIVYFVADIDLECLTALEAKIFEDSEEAGPAGNQQRGLDAGQHHRRWNVYLGIPAEWV